ncbi:FAD-dependent oxidoreductase [Shigella flexneri]
MLTVGTFLDGKIRIGLDHAAVAHAGDPPSIPLSRRLRELPLRVRSVKPGHHRVLMLELSTLVCWRNSMAITQSGILVYGQCDQHPQQVPCYITHTNEKTRDAIRSNLNSSPMYAGVIKRRCRPRAYCPSIEDKVMRFADRNEHQIFLEPEGLTF